jgi:betaine-aldehyde dehydrogenase
MEETVFGLAAGVFTTGLARGHRVIARLQADTLRISHDNVAPVALSFDNMKFSRFGYKNDRSAIEHYATSKSVYAVFATIDPPCR